METPLKCTIDQENGSFEEEIRPEFAGVVGLEGAEVDGRQGHPRRQRKRRRPVQVFGGARRDESGGRCC